MGRSVSYPSNAVVAFTTFETDYGPEDHDLANEDFGWFVDNFQYQVRDMFRSASRCDRWIGREDRAVMENDHAYFGVSEYCGLVALWVVPKDGTEHEALSERWVAQIASRFCNAFGTLRKLGHMSNGEGVYERIAA